MTEKTLLRLDDALASCDRAVVLARQLSDEELLVGLYGLQGEVLATLQRIDEARAARQRAVDLARRLPDHGQLTANLEALGDLLLGRGQADHAASFYAEAAELHRRRNDLAGRYRTMLQLGLLYQHTARWSQADAALAEALDLCRRTGDALREPYILAYQASTKLGLHHFADASRLASQAVVGYRQHNDPVGIGRSLAAVGQAQEGLGRTAEARLAYEEALELLAPVDEVGAAAVRSLLGR